MSAVYFKILYWHSSIGTKENHEMPPFWPSKIRDSLFYFCIHPPTSLLCQFDLEEGGSKCLRNVYAFYLLERVWHSEGSTLNTPVTKYANLMHRLIYIEFCKATLNKKLYLLNSLNTANNCRYIKYFLKMIHW